MTAWTGPSDITFGRDGKPFYMQGPYDNPMAVIQTGPKCTTLPMTGRVVPASEPWVSLDFRV